MPTATQEQARTISVDKKELSDEAAVTAASIVDAAVKEDEHSDEAETEAMVVSDPTDDAYESDGQEDIISI